MEDSGDKYFLQKIHLEGYKSIRATTIDLKGNLRIIIGKNAAGKTNFLWFLSRVLNNEFNSMYNLYDFRSVLTFTGESASDLMLKMVYFKP